MCSKPGGGTSQYSEGLRLRERFPFLPPPLGERDRLRLRRSRERLRRLGVRDRSLDLWRRVLPRSPTPPRGSRSVNAILLGYCSSNVSFH